METIAVGCEFQPRPDGNAVIEFFDGDGNKCCRQVVSAPVVRSIPLLAAVTDVALTHGPETAQEIMAQLTRGGCGDPGAVANDVGGDVGRCNEEEHPEEGQGPSVEHDNE
jgi:hypothetical protein